MNTSCVQITSDGCGVDESVEIYWARKCWIAVRVVHGNCLKVRHTVLVWI